MTRLYRSQRDKKIFGLCGGLAEAFHIDATVLRLIVVITAFFSVGTTIFIYIIASMVIPKESAYEGNHFAPTGASFNNSYSSKAHRQQPMQEQTSNIDEMMEDIEKKAMWKEIEQLRAKVAKYEKGDE